MPNAPLPRHVELRKLANQGAELKGDIPLNEMPRLLPLLLDEQGVIEVELSLGRDEEGIPIITGSAKAELSVSCQRCLQAMQHHLAAEFTIGMVWNEEQMPHLPKRLDPLIVEADATDLYALVEDELLLSLPYIFRHQPEDCSAPVSYVSVDEEADLQLAEQAKQDEKPNPFEILKELKNDQLKPE